MKALWEKFKLAIASFMQGRYGSDQFGMALLITGLVLTLLGSFIPLFSLLGLVLYGYCVFRLLSRNTQKRIEENRKFLAVTDQVKTKARQYKLRFDRRKEYKYFYCPKCKQLLRANRGSGTKHITCPRCSHEFDVKT